MLDQAVVGADRRSDRTLDEGGVAERLQRNPEDTIGEPLDRFGGELKREARLAAPPGTGQCQQPTGAKESPRLFEFALPADERRGWIGRFVRWSVLSGGKSSAPSW